MIYDFYKDIGYLAIIIFFILSLLLMGLTVRQVFCTIKFCTRHILSKAKIEFFLRIIIIITFLILGVIFIANFIKLSHMYYLYKSNKCSVITGNLTQITSVRNDYRDNEQYDISFNVGSIDFSDNNMNCSKDLREELLELENSEITVYYTKTDSGYWIHSIVK